MIFVTVGSSTTPFDRLLSAVDRLELSERLVVQHGPSGVRVRGASNLDYMPFDDVIGHIREARIVICHAGVGSILASLTNGKRPLVVPRLRRYHEAVDDHQLDLARRLHGERLVVSFEEPSNIVVPLDAQVTDEPLVRSGRLLQEVKDFVEREMGIHAASNTGRSRSTRRKLAGQTPMGRGQ